MRFQSVPARALQNYFRAAADRAIRIRPGAALSCAPPRTKISGNSSTVGALSRDEGQYATRQRADVSGRVHNPVERDVGAVSPAEVGDKTFSLCITKYLTTKRWSASLSLWL